MSKTVVATISSSKNLQTFDPNIISSLINKKNWERNFIWWERFHCFDLRKFYKNLYTVLWYQNAKIVLNKYTINLCQTVLWYCKIPGYKKIPETIY